MIGGGEAGSQKMVYFLNNVNPSFFLKNKIKKVMIYS
jgi:hypothetical protein